MTVLKPKVISLSIVLVILAAGLIVSCVGRKGDSHRAGVQMKGVSMAIAQYTFKHDGYLTPFDNPRQLETLLLPCLRDAATGSPRFAGVTLATPLLARPETGEPYIFIQALSGKSIHDYPHPETVVVFYESRDNYGGRLVAFLDGHHIWATAQQWGQMRAANGL